MLFFPCVHQISLSRAEEGKTEDAEAENQGPGRQNGPFACWSWGRQAAHPPSRIFFASDYFVAARARKRGLVSGVGASVLVAAHTRRAPE